MHDILLFILAENFPEKKKCIFASAHCVSLQLPFTFFLTVNEEEAVWQNTSIDQISYSLSHENVSLGPAFEKNFYLQFKGRGELIFSLNPQPK